jgi:Fic family protein
MARQNETYRTLKQIFHADLTDDRFINNQSLANERRSDLSAYNTGIQLRTGELFYTQPHELSVLTEKVLRLERKVSQLWRSLPSIALQSYIRDLISQEVVFTNQIEGVRSTRKEIESILIEINNSPERKQRKRFEEFVILYLNLTEEKLIHPHCPADIRSIYDDVMMGEIDSGDELDGELFRAKSVQVLDGQRAIHEGVLPESKIVSMLQQMIDLVADPTTPSLHAAFLSHFVFEYVHPFYDGNGRTGRLLLALYLTRPLSIATSLSLSRVIAENLSVYYKAFESVEDKLNHAEGTVFLIEMLRLTRLAQESLLEELQKKELLLVQGLDCIETYSQASSDEKKILYALLQTHLFANSPSMSLEQLSHHIMRSKATTRKYLARLEKESYVQAIQHKPLKFDLAEKALSLVKPS